MNKVQNNMNFRECRYCMTCIVPVPVLSIYIYMILSLYVHMHTFIPQTRHPFDFHKKKGVLALLIGASVATFLGLGGMQANKGGIQLVGLILEVQDQTKGLVFGMVHIKDSLLPMGKVLSLDSLASYFSIIHMSCVLCTDSSI